MRSMRKAAAGLFLFILFSAVFLQADQRAVLSSLAADLEQRASGLAQSSFDYFKGWNGAISDQEQAVLFKSEAFAASCRLFLKLAEERSDFFQASQLRTNLYSAFTYLFSSFQELDQEMQKTGVRPYELRDCRQVLRRMEQAFADWPSPDNLAYLDQHYVKDKRAAVYLIVKKSTTVFIKYPFKNLESLYRYNYDRNRGKNPWDYLVEVKTETLNKMEQGDLIDLNFEGRLVIEQSNRPNRPVYLIEDGKRRGLTSPSVLSRYGGWSKVFEVPDTVINSYPEGDPID